MKWKEKCIFAELEIASLKQTIAEQKITINALHHESETLCKQLAERDKEIEGLKKLSEDYKEGGSVEAEIVNELLEKGAKQKAALDIAREALEKIEDGREKLGWSPCAYIAKSARTEIEALEGKGNE